MVSIFQHAFVKGKQILDVILIPNEAINSQIKNFNREVICKLDIEKVCNHITWDFLVASMEKMGFWPKVGQFNQMVHFNNKIFCSS